METIQQDYSFGTEFIDDFGAKQNLLEITGDRIIKLQNELNDNFFLFFKNNMYPFKVKLPQVQF